MLVVNQIIEHYCQLIESNSRQLQKYPKCKLKTEKGRVDTSLIVLQCPLVLDQLITDICLVRYSFDVCVIWTMLLTQGSQPSFLYLVRSKRTHDLSHLIHSHKGKLTNETSGSFTSFITPTQIADLFT